jgi:VanZ family protein
MVWLRRTCWALTAAYWVGIFVMTHLPPPVVRRMVPDIWDKLAHFLIYFGLAAALGTTLILTYPRRRSIPLWVLGVGFVYGAIDELLQPFVRRDASVLDWVADALGVWAGVLVLWALQRFVVPAPREPVPEAG